MSASKNDLDSRMSLLKPTGLGERIRQLARHAPDSNDLDALIAKVLIHAIGTLLDNHIENHWFMAVLPQICRQMDIVDRNILDISIKRRHGPDEGYFHTGQILTKRHQSI